MVRLSVGKKGSNAQRGCGGRQAEGSASLLSFEGRNYIMMLGILDTAPQPLLGRGFSSPVDRTFEAIHAGVAVVAPAVLSMRPFQVRSTQAS